MVDKGKRYILRLRNDTRLISGIYMVTLITALLILALVIKGPEKTGSFITDSDGNITGISRNRMDRSETYDMKLAFKEGEDHIERDVRVILQAQESGGSIKKTDEEEEKQAAIEAGIDSVISEIEYSKGKKIALPDTLPDGTAITWTASESRGSSLFFIIPVIYLALIILMISGTGRRDRPKDEKRKTILRGLPRFCNQLFLMMNAGLILSDAFDMITDSYRNYDETELSSFERELADLADATDGHRISTASVISEYAAENDVKELIRIAAILTENEKRGSDVIDSLARESKYLWDERKVVARECGKSIDTKMSYPLGLLLILLIIITMAPALLNM